MTAAAYLDQPEWVPLEAHRHALARAIEELSVR